jgi:hypothetical protein
MQVKLSHPTAYSALLPDITEKITEKLCVCRPLFRSSASRITPSVIPCAQGRSMLSIPLAPSHIQVFPRKFYMRSPFCRSSCSQAAFPPAQGLDTGAPSLRSTPERLSKHARNGRNRQVRKASYAGYGPGTARNGNCNRDGKACRLPQNSTPSGRLRSAARNRSAALLASGQNWTGEARGPLRSADHPPGASPGPAVTGAE